MEKRLSIQQDKRVVKPSKWSERYARWFSTRVPSTSPMFRYMVVFILAIPWSYIYFSIPGMIMDIYFLVPITSAFGLVIYGVYLTILKNRFELSIPDKPFLQLVNSALDRTGTGGRVVVWPRFDDEPYITSTYNSSFEAVIVSTKMVELMNAMPESGEALLAFHLLRMPERKNVLDFVAGVLTFSVSSTSMTILLLYLMSFSASPIIILIFMIALWPVFVMPLILILALRSALWSHETSFERTLELYKIHPQVAKDEVISSQKIDEELSKSTIWSVKKWEEDRRSGRRTSISILTIIIIIGLESYLLFLNPIIFFSLFGYYQFLSLAFPAIVGILVFLIIRRWDQTCMGEIYYEVTEAHERIWID